MELGLAETSGPLVRAAGFWRKRRVAESVLSWMFGTEACQTCNAAASDVLYPNLAGQPRRVMSIASNAFAPLLAFDKHVST